MVTLRPRPRRAAALVLAVTALAACGTDDGAAGPSRAAVEASVEATYDATAEQATCVTDFAVEDYAPDELAVIVDDGVTALPLGRWDAWFHSVVTCIGTTDG